jgi:thioredoxin 1
MSHEVIDVKSDADFKKILKSNTVCTKNTVFIKFSADWCGPCKTIHPLYKKLAKEHTNCIFLHVDVDACEKVSKEYNVKSLPTFVVLDVENLKELDKMTGANSEKLTKLVNAYKDI